MHSRFLQVLLASLCLVAIGFASQTPTEQSAPGIGIGVGEKMPSFTAEDQFGHQVSSDALRGANGTVLLFFRSADW